MFDPCVFNHQPYDFIHRRAIDIVTGQTLGLVREIVLRFQEEEDGTVIPFITVAYLADGGYEREVAYDQDEVGFLDISDFCLTQGELLAHLDGFREDLRLYEQFYGPAHDETVSKKQRYEALVDDVRAIMCANNWFRLENLQNLFAQHFLTGLA